MTDKTKGQRMLNLLVIFLWMIVYHQYYHLFDTDLSCHTILVFTSKNIYGYIVRKTDNHQLEGFGMFAKDSEIGKAHGMET